MSRHFTAGSSEYIWLTSALAPSGVSNDAIGEGMFSQQAPYTLGAWINCPTPGVAGNYWGEGHHSFIQQFFQCQINTSGKAAFFARSDGNSGTSELNGPVTVATVADNTWHHVVFTQDGAATCTYRIYVDGAQDSTGTYVGAATTLNRALIGGLFRNITFSNFYTGFVSDVFMVRRMVGPGEVAAVYAGMSPLRLNPAHYWPLLGNTTEPDFGYTQSWEGRPIGGFVSGSRPLRQPVFKPSSWQDRYPQILRGLSVKHQKFRSVLI